jgi:hypothetical protein
VSKWFAPPFEYDGPTHYVAGQDRYYPVEPKAQRLFRWYNKRVGRAVGRTVLKIDGSYATYVSPTQVQVAEADEVYLGGHQYEVSDEVGAALTAAGYTVYDTPEDSPLVHNARLIQ